MRAFLIILATTLLIAIAFGVYLLTQSAPAAHDGTGIAPIPTTAPLTPQADGAQAHEGEAVLIKSYDPKTMELASQFGATDYDPQKDGTTNMTHPQAIFYMGGGSKLQLDGETGNVVVPNTVNGKIQGQSQTPTRGKLRHVILKLFKNTADTEPQFTCWLNNVAFDNDTFRIATEAADIPDATGKLVPTPADEVPVHVEGIDYDFDGRGLYIKWNERDRKLQRLEIAHGEQLIIKHPAASMGEEQQTISNEQRATLDSDSSARSPVALPVMLASADPKDALSEAAAAKKPVHAPRKRPVTKPVVPAPVIHRSKDASQYRATFYDNVHITQLDATLATADRMNADFFMGGGGSSTRPSSGPSVGPATRGNDAAAHRAANEKSRRGVAPVTRATEPRTVATSQPAATRPAEPPMIVRWTGKLIVIPPSPDVPVLATGDSALELVGDSEPAVLDRDGTVIHCARFRYQTLHRDVELRNSPALPIVTIVSTDGTRIVAPAVDYNGAELTADIPGPAHAEFKVAADALPTASTRPSTAPSTRPTSTARVDWADSCALQLIPGDHQQPLLREAVLDGDVHVDHPQIKLIGDELDLGFDTATKSAASTVPTTRPVHETAELRSMDATGHVNCTLIDAQSKLQHVTSDHLTLATVRDARGEVTPSLVTADGNVHTFDDTQSLKAGHLIATLEPSTRPAIATAPTTAPTRAHSGGDVQLHELTAQDDVHFQTAAGDFADADILHVGAGQDIDLFGAPTARVGDRDSIISGPVIRYDPAGRQARVVGAGTLHSLGQSAHSATQASASTRPVDITWNNSLAMDGLKNRVNIAGGVQARSTSADGTVNTADGDHIIMTLVDAPATQPATQPSTKIASTATRPAPLIGGPQANFMKDKQVSFVSLFAREHQTTPVVQSQLRGPQGALLRSLDLLAPIVNYDKINERFIVPTPGRMLVRDLRSESTTKPATDTGMTAGGMKGTTAFEWQKSLVYDQLANTATMTGNVHVVHQNDASAGYEMFANQIITDIDSSKPTTLPTTDQTANSTTKPDEPDAFKVKKLTARGAVRMVSARLQFEAAEAEYDPQTQIMIARGSAREPATLYDSQGLSTGNFDELQYNTRTDQVGMTNAHTNLRR